MAKFPYKNILEGVKHIWTKSQGPDAEGAAVTANPLTVGYKDAEGKATGVTPTNMLPVGDAAAQAKLAEILAKLSADPATQTTLAAILAKLISAPATEAKQDTLIGHVDGVESALAAVLAKLSADPATQTTLAAILAKIIAAPATEAKQDTIIGHVDGIEGALTTLNGKDFATQTTLAQISAKIIAAPATEAKQTALNALIGEVQAAPTANTLLARLKNLEDVLNHVVATPITGVATVTATAAEIFAGVARLAGRRKMLIKNEDPVLRIRIGGLSVTQQNGFPVEPGAVLELDFDPTDDTPIYAVSEGVAVAVAVMEY